MTAYTISHEQIAGLSSLINTLADIPQINTTVDIDHLRDSIRLNIAAQTILVNVERGIPGINRPDLPPSNDLTIELKRA
jgi:hypothetical protein